MWFCSLLSNTNKLTQTELPVQEVNIFTVTPRCFTYASALMTEVSSVHLLSSPCSSVNNTYLQYIKHAHMSLYIKFTYGLEMHDQQNNLLASFYSDKLFRPVVCVEYCKSFKVLKEHISLGILNKIMPFLTQTNCRSDKCTHECTDSCNMIFFQ